MDRANKSRLYPLQVSQQNPLLAYVISSFVFLFFICFLLYNSFLNSQLLIQQQARIAEQMLRQQLAGFDNQIKLLVKTLELQEPKDESDLLRHFSYEPQWQGFHLDDIPSQYESRILGNISGAGQADSLSKSARDMMTRLLATEPFFQASRNYLAELSVIYFTGKQDYLYLYPRLLSLDWHFTAAVKQANAYLLGLPQNNLNKESYYSRVFHEALHKNLMFTLSSPVYVEGTFMGTLSLELDISALSETLSTAPIPVANLLLVNVHNQVLATPQYRAWTSDKILQLSDYLSQSELLILEGGGVNQWSSMDRQFFWFSPLIKDEHYFLLLMDKRDFYLYLLDKEKLGIGLLLICNMLMIVVIRLRQAYLNKQAAAQVDPVTGLPSSRFFLAELVSKLEFTKSRQGTLVLFLLYIELKESSAWEQELSADLLRLVAGRLVYALRQGDCVCRLNADEFAVFTIPKQLEDIEKIEAKMLSIFDKAVTIDEEKLLLKVQVVSGLYPLEAKSTDELLSKVRAKIKRNLGAQLYALKH